MQDWKSVLGCARLGWADLFLFSKTVQRNTRQVSNSFNESVIWLRWSVQGMLALQALLNLFFPTERALCFQYPYDQSSDNLIPAGSPQVTRVFSLVSIRKSKPWNQSKAPFYNSIYLFPGLIILTAYSCDLFKIGKLHIYHWTLQYQRKHGVQSNHSTTLFSQFELENHSVQKIYFLPLTLMQASWCE